jgi:predicted transcriptional regulator YdeE
MTPKIVQQPGFDIIGIEVRTNNAREISGSGVIAAQWQSFMKDDVLNRIPSRADTTIYALYTGYASDRNGDYDYVLGARVTAHDRVPAGMMLKHVPAGKYAVITSDKGPGFQVVPAAWQKIWKMEDGAALGGKRAYATDFEVYDERARDPQAAQIDVYVALK